MIAAIFTRVSTTKDVQKDSLNNQEDILRETCRIRGWKPYEYIYKESVSGTKENREEINLLLTDAKDGKFQVIIAKELSRLARNQEFSSKIIKQLKVLGVHLVTLDGAIDTTKNSSDMTGLFSWLYEFESTKISSRIKKVFEQKYKNGEFLGSNAPYGYYINGKKLYIRDDETPDVIRRIYRMFQNGEGFSRIARILYEDNTSTPSQVAKKKNASQYWHSSSVRGILENRHYCGDLSQGRETSFDVTIKKRKNVPLSEHIIVENTHDGIISKEEFELVQELIKKRRKPAQSNPNVKTRPHEIIHPFTELLICGSCGKHYHYKSRKRNTYVCGLYNKHGSKACKANAINEDSLIEIIRNDLKSFSKIINRDNLYNILKKKQVYEHEKSKQRIRVVHDKIEMISSKKVKAMDNFMDGVFSKEQFDNYIVVQDNELLSLGLEISELEAKISNKPNELDIDKVKTIVDEALEFNDWSRGTLNRFIDKIVVHSSKEIEIFYRFSSIQDEFMDLIEYLEK